MNELVDKIKNYPTSATPMMRQYLNIKQAYQDTMLFFRMGDFYELFFDDAVKAADILDITLTKRGKHQDQEIPMCGVPYHSCEPYLNKLIESGNKVAICEQMESPEEAKKRGGYSAVVKREVIRIITPGTITEDVLLDSTSANYLCSISQNNGKLAISWVDISTGDFYVETIEDKLLLSELTRIDPKEILISDQLFADDNFRTILAEWKNKLTTHVNSFFDSRKLEKRILEFYNINSLQSFNLDNNAEIAACGSLIEYITITQVSNTPKLKIPKKHYNSKYLLIDASTRKSLELNKTLSGNYSGSLLSVINKTVTSSGSRLLKQFLNLPLTEVELISHRLDAVGFFIHNHELKNNLRKFLHNIPDLERSLARICLKRATTRDLLAIRIGLEFSLNIAAMFENIKLDNIPAKINEYRYALDANEYLIALLRSAINDEVPFQLKDGGFVRSNYNPQLDNLRSLNINSKAKIQQLRDKYRQMTGINTLKVTHNNVLGFYVEVTSQHAKKMDAEFFNHRQTLASVIRYNTEELIALENEIVSASFKIQAIEENIFNFLIEEIITHAEYIRMNADAIAHLDVFAAFADLAIKNNYTRPEVNKSAEINIIGARHPVVEENIKFSSHNKFVANDCNLSADEQIWLITGPNMAGKSTYLRQNALIIILAQMGCYVPAKHASIGFVDKLFSRVGAADDLAKGQSTFMVEMTETATILNQSTNRSLVILDEIGRGTATYDGLSIAYATLEYLHNELGVRTLFATHYHELTSLTERLNRIKCYTMKVKEWKGNIIFLHEIIPGIAQSSYGIYVAKIAGIPTSVIKRAENILAHLNNDNLNDKLLELPEEMPLFASNNSANISAIDDNVNEEILLDSHTQKIIDIINNVDLNEISPRDAYRILEEIKNLN